MSADYMDASSVPYPARLDIDYPEEGLSRLTTLFRIILVIPIVVVIGLLGGGAPNTQQVGEATWIVVSSGGFLFAPTLLMLLFRRKYPRWWFDWNLELYRFSTRVGAYLLLMRDEYPSTDEEQAVRLDLDYPDAERDLNRWLPLIKWLLAIPHFIVLTILAIVAMVLLVVAWFAILFTGRYPRGLFRFMVGLNRWALRVTAYMWLLTTDRYPPFSFEE
ncbi:MAG: DUF4389 domain-containing protein [Chloroflexota bacterium]|nr:DUF4389 domain-containing protein [Chloroflexota bacterium]